MVAHGAHALIADQTETLFYFTGFDLSEITYRACVIPREGETFVVVRGTDAGAFGEHSAAGRAFGYADWDDRRGFLRGGCASTAWQTAVRHDFTYA